VRLRAWSCVLCSMVLCALGAARVQGQGANPRYQTSIEQAVREFGAGNYAEARALFRKAHAISPNARTWRGMGMAAFELKLYVDAQRELSAALENKERPLTDDQRVQVQSLLDQSHAFVGRYQVLLQPAHARVSVDGQEASFEPDQVLLLDLGDHVLSAVADGYQEARVPLHVDGGEDQVLRVELAPPAAAGEVTAQGAPAAPTEPSHAVAASTEPAAPRAALQPHDSSDGLEIAAFVTLGGAALLGGVSAAFWISGNAKYQKLERTCAGFCSEAQLAALKTSDLLTTVFLGAAIAAAATASALFVIDLSAPDSRSSAALRVSPQGIVLHGSF
jgi:hypothetical protein